MHIIVVGLNYRTAPVEIREQFTFSEQELPEALQALKDTKSILECVIVNTCNRTELYAVVDQLHVCGHFIRDYLAKRFNIQTTQFTNHLYIYEDEEAMDHLFRVTTGLDSMVIGETQILGQVKQSFLSAQKQKTTGTFFNMLFKQAVTMAKRAHNETSIGESAVSVSYAAVELGKRIFGDFRRKNVMIVGAGKMSELTARHLYSQGVKEVFVVNRTLDRALELSRQFQGTAVPIEEMVDRMNEVDIIITSTGSNQYILTPAEMKQMKSRMASRPLFIIDIAVPRDVDPEISQMENIFLYDIDDLEGIVDSNLEQRKKEAEKIEGMIKVELAEYQQWYKTLGVGPVIRAVQEKSAAIHQETMDSLLNKLPDLDEREIKVIQKLTKSMVNQMLHEPIQRLKERSAQKHGEVALDMFGHLFAIEERVKELELESQQKSVKDKQLKKEMEQPMYSAGQPQKALARY